MQKELISIIILVVMLVCYISKILPIGATSVIGALAMVMFGILPLSDVLSQFVSDVVLLQIGVMIIGGAFFEVGLAEDLGRFISKHFIKNGKVFLVVVILLATLISAFISNTATVAMFIPIIAAAEVASEGKIRQKDSLMAIGMASVLGGNLTLFASTPQMAVQNILAGYEIEGVRTLGVFELSKTALPLALLLPIFFVIFGYKLQNKMYGNDPVVTGVETKKEEITKPLWKKIAVLAIYLGCIVVFIGGWISIGLTAIIGGLLCVCTRCISEKKAFQSVNLTIVFMLGGLLAFSSGFAKSGAGTWIVDFFISIFGGTANAFVLYAVIIIIGVILTSVMSNTAVAAMLVPIGITMAIDAGANPMTFVVGVILASNIAFCTPIATAPVTMTMCGGYKFSDYFKIGGIFTVISTLYVLLIVPLILGL